MQSNTQKFTSQTLQFDLLEKFWAFTIIFEAVSPQRNLLKDVIFEGFHLDTVDLQRTHPILYNRINIEMAWHSKAYWEAKPIPDKKENLATKTYNVMLTDSLSHFSTLEK